MRERTYPRKVSVVYQTNAATWGTPWAVELLLLVYRYVSCCLSVSATLQPKGRVAKSHQLLARDIFFPETSSRLFTSSVWVARRRVLQHLALEPSYGKSRPFGVGSSRAGKQTVKPPRPREIVMESSRPCWPIVRNLIPNSYHP